MRPAVILISKSGKDITWKENYIDIKKLEQNASKTNPPIYKKEFTITKWDYRITQDYSNIWKSINIIYIINKIKYKNHMIINRHRKDFWQNPTKEKISLSLFLSLSD